jgi:hypothetical protein
MTDARVAVRFDDFPLDATNEFDNDLSDQLRARVKSELEPGERLLWAACSRVPPFRLGRGFLCFAVIALFLIVLGVNFVTYALWQPRAWEQYMPGGVCFLGFGGAFVVGMVANLSIRLRDRRRIATVFNAVTDRRVIVWTPDTDGDAIRIETIARGQVGNLVRIERPDGSGTLEFSRTHSDFDYYHRFKFEQIPEVRRVEQIVRSNLTAGGPVA